MNDSVQVIPLWNLLALAFPVVLVLMLMVRWSLNAGNALYSVARMLGQLLIIGYFLTFIFETDGAGLVLLVLSIMAFASSWIALGSLEVDRSKLLWPALLAIGLCGAAILALVTQVVLVLDPWYLPQYMIPLAGMVFANSMNSVSLATERILAEISRGEGYPAARHTAMQAAMIPVVNSMFAVGLVSLPGMMTGQILSGISPLIAVRYQIMVMCMIFAGAGLSTAAFLVLARKQIISDFNVRQQNSG